MLRESTSIESTSFTVKDHALPSNSSFSPRFGLVSRVRQRLFPPTLPADDSLPASSSLPAGYKHKSGFQASIAEALLVTRLKARSEQAADGGVLERAAEVIFVTCKYWFASPQDRVKSHKTRL